MQIGKKAGRQMAYLRNRFQIETLPLIKFFSGRIKFLLVQKALYTKKQDESGHICR